VIVTRGLGRSAFVGAIVAVGLGIGASEHVEASVPSDIYGSGIVKREDVSIDYVRDLWELQELRLKGRIEPEPEIVGQVAPAESHAASNPFVADNDVSAPIALAIEPVQDSSLAADGDQIDADTAKAAHAAKLKRNKAALLLILAEL
jgi:hypothetical protein